MKNDNPHIDRAWLQMIHQVVQTKPQGPTPPVPSGLTPSQRQAFKGVKWLLDPKNRAFGRTYLLAHVLIHLAIENPGTAISLFDHGLVEGMPHAIGTIRGMMPVVQMLLEEEYKDFKIVMRLSDRTIVYAP